MKTARELLTEYGLTPNKALGQNFLVDEEAIERIVSAAAGPGLPVAAVELDAAMCGVLSSALPENAAVINADFLKADLGLIHEKLGGGEISVVGNLPYYITSPICMRLLTEGLPIRRMTLMMQKEAADRFTAEPGDKNYGPLTVLAQLLYSIRQELSLSPASYFPQPEVSSCVLVLDRSGFSLPAPLPRLLKSAFAMRRTTLLNNLSAMGMTKTAAAELIEKRGSPPPSGRRRYGRRTLCVSLDNGLSAPRKYRQLL